MISSRRPPEVLLDQIFPLLEKLTVKYKSLKLLQTGSNVRHLRLEGDQAIGSLQGLSSLETLTAWNAETATEIMVEHAQTLQCIELVSLNPCDLRTISQTETVVFPSLLRLDAYGDILGARFPNLQQFISRSWFTDMTPLTPS